MAAGSIVVQSNVRDMIKGIDPEVRVGDEFLTALTESLQNTVKEAIERCKANGRKTLQKQDL